MTLTARFLAISARVGAFSTSSSDLELDESVEDPEAADACSILLSDSLLSGQFGVSAILHVQGNVSGPDRTSVYYNKLLCRLIDRLFPNYSRYFSAYYAQNYAGIFAAACAVPVPPTFSPLVFCPLTLIAPSSLVYIFVSLSCAPLNINFPVLCPKYFSSCVLQYLISFLCPPSIQFPPCVSPVFNFPLVSPVFNFPLVSPSIQFSPCVPTVFNFPLVSPQYSISPLCPHSIQFPPCVPQYSISPLCPPVFNFPLVSPQYSIFPLCPPNI